jgi:hypothetical protein
MCCTTAKKLNRLSSKALIFGRVRKTPCNIKRITTFSYCVPHREHYKEMAALHEELSDNQQIKRHNDEFPGWFREKVSLHSETQYPFAQTM